MVRISFSITIIFFVIQISSAQSNKEIFRNLIKDSNLNWISEKEIQSDIFEILLENEYSRGYAKIRFTPVYKTDLDTRENRSNVIRSKFYPNLEILSSLSLIHI